jgi:gas vesicle protein
MGITFFSGRHHTIGRFASVAKDVNRRWSILPIGRSTNVEDDSRFSYFLLGVGLGVAVGILFAPKSGSETRELIRAKAGEGKEYVKKRSEDLKEGAGELVERGRGLVNRQKDQLNAAVEAGKQAYREAVSSAEHYPAAD